jgi:predicted secreted protein
MICCISILLFHLLSCSFVPPQELNVDISSSGKKLVLSQYGILTITLEYDATSGSIWIEKTNIRDSFILELKDHKYIPADTPTPGTTGSEIWIFEAPNPGTTGLSLEYRAPYQSALVYKTFDLTISIAKK